MSRRCQLTIIIPTIASAARARDLRRAIDSVRDQSEPCRILCVVNGDRRDDDVVASVRAVPRVGVLEQAEGNLVKALAAGVAAVETPFFSILDDDDILLPGACARRVAAMQARPDADVVATPGLKRWISGREEPLPDRFDADDPMNSLFVSQWLPSCGGVFRRATVGPEFFAAMPRYLEYTDLAFRLLRQRRVAFLFDDAPHFIVFQTEGSDSASLEHTLALPRHLERIRAAHLPPRVDRAVARKIAGLRHRAAVQCLRAGRVAEAWRYHVGSLRDAGGLRYLLFTRHFLLAPFRATRASR